MLRASEMASVASRCFQYVTNPAGHDLRELGHKIVVLELQGDLVFASAEVVVSEAMKGAQEADYLVLDFRRTASISEGAMNLLGHLVQALDAKGKAILFAGIRDEFHLARAIRKRVPHVRDLPLLKCTAPRPVCS